MGFEDSFPVAWLRRREGHEGTPRRDFAAGLGTEGLEPRTLMAAPAQLTPTDVQTLLDRAAGATAADNAIVAVVDRQGRPLGIRVEGNVSPAITGNTEKLVFAIDGALAEARTAAMFANNQGPLSSRTIQDISQSTMTQREVQSDPNTGNMNSTLQGPGFVAPIGVKGHFPPRVSFTPQVDLFEIEHTNRDSVIHPNAAGVRAPGPGNSIILPDRFNADPAYVPPGQSIAAPESYGLISGLLPYAQARGIGTLPGGVPLYKGTGNLVGGIGVFFPGTTGFATEENSSLNDAGFYDPKKPDLSEEAEYIAFVAAGGSSGAGYSTNTAHFNAAKGLPPLPGFDIPFGRIDLVGITLDLFGAHGLQGPRNLVDFGGTLGTGNVNSGVNVPVTLPLPGAVGVGTSTGLAAALKDVAQGAQTAIPGDAVPSGWIVTPHAAADGSLTAADVTEIVQRGIAEANRIRSAIRVPLNSTAKMIFAVTDNSGNLLGLYRMPDATYFSFDVAVAKARNVAYYANPAELQAVDQVPGLPKGVAMTNRTFRYLSLPHFPEGQDQYPPGPFSILNETQIRESGVVQPASAFQTVQGYDSFNPQSNFHDPYNIANQNGIVFFPGSAPLYKDVNGSGKKVLVGGLGVSGDGVDQDDDVTYQAAVGFTPPPTVTTADEVKVRGVRLPYQKFNRQPHVPINGTPSPLIQINTPKPNIPKTDSPGQTPANAQRIQIATKQVLQKYAQNAGKLPKQPY